jgi:phosphatidylinositol alpha 1,6-mannosyltransferase
MPRVPRVAFFPDSFHEVNGVAHTARQFTAWAGRTGKPFLCIRAGERSKPYALEGTVESLELPRGFASFALDKDLRYDPLYWRHTPRILGALRAFRPDLIHITGPSELGMLGAALAHHLQVPLAASWHTNVHEYAASRSLWALHLLPARFRPSAAFRIQAAALRASAFFYSRARILFAPNPALCLLLTARTGRPCALMPRGIDAQLFSPAHRTVPDSQPLLALNTASPSPQHAHAQSHPGACQELPPGPWTLGYVGRLSIEKNVALLPTIARELNSRFHSLGLPGVRFLIIGQGAQEQALRAAMPDATFAGVLRGLALAQAYANMDCFVFPSHTDTFGNVVLEALASGVPAVVTPDGGPAHIIRSSSGAGSICQDAGFPQAIAAILADPIHHACLRAKARAYAETASWDSVFKGVYDAYCEAGMDAR